MTYFVHPYPRYGLAAVLFHGGIKSVTNETLPEKKELAKLAAEYIRATLHQYRLHTEDKPAEDYDSELTFRYLKAEELATNKSAGQSSENLYYLAPHIVTADTSANKLIDEAKEMSEKLSDGKDLDKTVDLKRSFSPFTTKINQGSKSLSNPKATLLQAGFTMVATLTSCKPAVQSDFRNQVIIPDLPLNDLICFIDLFNKMCSHELSNIYVRNLKAGRKNYRPPLFNGNYPNAPNAPVFGPVGLVGAMGEWARRQTDYREDLFEVLQKIVKNPIYLVSYEVKLFRQVHLGHHVARLAKEYNLPKAINGLYYAEFYNRDQNKLDNPTRLLFLKMATRFLQLYTQSSFKDFLAFRLEYPHSFLPILEDYFMNEKTIPKAIIQSARSYGSYLNLVAYLIAKAEVENKKTGRDLYEAKARVLAQLESTAMSCKTPTALFAQLNVQAGRMTHRDVPEGASTFMEATNSGEVSLETAQQLILAYMRLRDETNKSETESSSTKGETFSTN